MIGGRCFIPVQKKKSSEGPINNRATKENVARAESLARPETLSSLLSVVSR